MRKQFKLLTKMLELVQHPLRKIECLIALVSIQFDSNPNTFAFLPVDVWRMVRPFLAFRLALRN